MNIKFQARTRYPISAPLNKKVIYYLGLKVLSVIIMSDIQQQSCHKLQLVKLHHHLKLTGSFFESTIPLKIQNII